jgi:hypothetical protein
VHRQAARFMSEHLLQQTLSPEMAAMAEYYEQGVTLPTLTDAAASRYGRFTAGGIYCWRTRWMSWCGWKWSALLRMALGLSVARIMEEMN